MPVTEGKHTTKKEQQKKKKHRKTNDKNGNEKNNGDDITTMMSKKSTRKMLKFHENKAKWANRCDVWIVERMRYRPTDGPTDTAIYRGALSRLKT